MSHEIAQKNGMHSFARASGTAPAWHRLGQTFELTDSREVKREKSGLDYTVHCVPAQYFFNGEWHTSNHFHMVRSDTSYSLSVRSERFIPHQTSEVIDIAEDLCERDPRFAMETMGALKMGRVIFGLAKYKEQLIAGGDAHELYVLLTTSFDGSLATRMVATPTRVVCDNTLTAAMYQANREKAYVSVRHSKALDAAATGKMVEDFGEMLAEFDNYRRLADAFAQHRFAKDKVDEFFNKLTIAKAMAGKAEDATPTGRAKAAEDRLQSAYADELVAGTDGGTAWAMLNGVTRYVDHHRTTRDTNGDGKAGAQLHSMLIGSGAALKRDAVKMLAEWCGVTLAGGELVD